ncbi:TPA: hypothetical protein ACMDWL_004439 [Vibrio parahaemolyticus]
MKEVANIKTVKTKTDMPAISAAAIAGAISVSMGSGPYGLLSAVIGISLVVFLYAYAWSTPKTTMHRHAFSSIYSFLFLLIFAPILELLARFEIPLDCREYYFTSFDILQYQYGNELNPFCFKWIGYNSLVSENILIVIWLAMYVLVFTMQHYDSNEC